MERVDFAVVGAGIAGASAAYFLAEHGSVVVYEMEVTPGYHTTGRSAALYTESYGAREVRVLTIAGHDFFRSPPPGFSDVPLLAPLPVLYVGRDDQRDTLEQIHRETRDDTDIRPIDTEAIEALCPVIRVGHITVGLLELGAMEIDVHGLHQGFLAGARARGARIATGAEVKGLHSTRAGWEVEADDGAVAASVVVNAAGAWCDTIATAAGAKPLGLQPYRRTAFTFGPGDLSIDGWPMVVDADEDFYFKPDGVQLMGSLAEETPMEPHDVRPEEIDVALALDRINEATTLGIRHVRSTWAGLRTFAPDRKPVVGFDSDRPGLFWLAGQGGYGIMTAPGMGRAASSLIVEGRLPHDLHDAGLRAEHVSPARFKA